MARSDARIVATMIQIRQSAADQIVDNADRESAVEQQVDHVAADEAGSAGHHSQASAVDH